MEVAAVGAPAVVGSAVADDDDGDNGSPCRRSSSGSAEVEFPGGGGSGGAVSAEGGAGERGGAMTHELHHQQHHEEQHQPRTTTTSTTYPLAMMPVTTTTKPTATITTPQPATTTPTTPKTMTLCLAVSYGGRAEVAAAARELATDVAAGRLEPADVDETTLSRRLSTARLGIPDPDLVVRTSGECRLSNLLLWQAAYAELCVVGKAWPEFHRRDLVETFR